MGELAPRGRHAACGSSACAHHEIWIPVAVVWRRRHAAEGFDRRTTAAAGVAAETRGVHPGAAVAPLLYGHFSDVTRMILPVHFSS
jgi:hypothetical protein